MSDEEFDQRATDNELANSMLATAQLDAQAIIAGIKHRLVLLQTARRKLELTQVSVPMPTRRERMSGGNQVRRRREEGQRRRDGQGRPRLLHRRLRTGHGRRAQAAGRRARAVRRQVQDGQQAEVHVDVLPRPDVRRRSPADQSR